MRMMDFLDAKAVLPDVQATDKEGVLNELLDSLAGIGVVKDKQRMLDVLLAREELGSTGIGNGIAIPHGKCEGIKKMTAALGLSKKGVNFNALDGEPVYIFFLLVAPQDSAGPHLKALATISRFLKDRFFRDALKQSPDIKTILEVIRKEEEKR